MSYYLPPWVLFYLLDFPHFIALNNIHEYASEINLIGPLGEKNFSNCMAFILLFCHFRIIQFFQYLENEWTEFNQILFTHYH